MLHCRLEGLPAELIGEPPPQLHSREPPQVHIQMKIVTGARRLFIGITVSVGKLLPTLLMIQFHDCFKAACVWAGVKKGGPSHVFLPPLWCQCEREW